MKFWVPAADTQEQETQVYDAIKSHLKDGLGAEFSDRKIQKIDWTHEGKAFSAEVGEDAPAYFNGIGELVIAIFYEPLRNLYHICTPNRGVLRGLSILAGSNSVRNTIDFDE